MGCITGLVALPFKLAGTLGTAGGIVLIASGIKTRHPGFFALGAVCGLVGMVFGYFWWLGALTAAAGGLGYWQVKKLPRR